MRFFILTIATFSLATLWSCQQTVKNQLQEDPVSEQAETDPVVEAQSEQEVQVTAVAAVTEETTSSEEDPLPKDPAQKEAKANSTSAYAVYVGTHASPFNAGGQYFGELTISQIKNNQFQFSINTSLGESCVGEVSGWATFTEEGKGLYSDDECEQLTFQFFSDKITVGEQSCELHGMNCGFGGDFIFVVSSR